MAAEETATRPRRRNAAATRQALLSAARTLMSEHGIEGTSTRDVAAAAGVNQALVYRYFGSKEALFAEAAGRDAETDEDFASEIPLADVPRRMLERLLDASAEHETQLSSLLAASNDEMVRDIIRKRIDTDYRTRLSARLAGEDAEVRAELLAALMTGVGVLKQRIGTRALSAADRATLGKWIDRMAAGVLTAD